MAKPTSHPKYVAWLHTQPCCVSGRFPVEAHHLTRLQAMCRITRNDRYMVPLAFDLHNFGKLSVHSLGVTKFEATHGVDLTALAEHYWKEWNNG